jgi:hypothetical protein
LLELKLDHLRAMTDGVGLFQHATLSAPNPAFGYCTDDNARALLFVTQALEASPGDAVLRDLSDVYFAFLQRAFGTQAGVLRNLISHDLVWADEDGPGDAPGRALWALGISMETAPSLDARMASRVMFERSLPMIETLSDLRPISCAIQGLCAYLRRRHSSQVWEVLELLTGCLNRRFEAATSPEWPWPENMLTYENARLPHALLVAGRSLSDKTMVERGSFSLGWLLDVQTNNGQFAPIGNDGWYRRGGTPARFDQQPIEADATIAACLDAFRADGEPRWLAGATSAYNWFLGENALGESICVPETGACCDGMSPTRVNQNQGAESTLAWLTSQLNMQTLTALANASSLAVIR